MRRPCLARKTFSVLSIFVHILLIGSSMTTLATSAHAERPAVNPDAPPTEVRFQWIRHEHQRPDEPSPRPRGSQQNPFRNNFDSLRLAIEDLTETFGSRYPHGAKYLEQLIRLEKTVKETDAPLGPLAEEFDRLFQESLLANPLIDFDRLLFVDASNPMTPRNWLSLDSVGGTARPGDVVLKVLSPVSPDGEVTTLFIPPRVPSDYRGLSEGRIFRLFSSEATMKEVVCFAARRAPCPTRGRNLEEIVKLDTSLNVTKED